MLGLLILEIHAVLEFVINLLESLDLFVSHSHLCQNLIKVDVLENLQVFLFALELVYLLLVAAFVALKSNLFVIELLKLHVETLDQLLIVSQVTLCQLKFLPSDLLSFLRLTKLLP